MQRQTQNCKIVKGSGNRHTLDVDGDVDDNDNDDGYRTVIRVPVFMIFQFP